MSNKYLLLEVVPSLLSSQWFCYWLFIRQSPATLCYVNDCMSPEIHHHEPINASTPVHFEDKDPPSQGNASVAMKIPSNDAIRIDFLGLGFIHKEHCDKNCKTSDIG